MRRFFSETVLYAFFLCLLSPIWGQEMVVRPPVVFDFIGGGSVDLGQRVTLSVSINAQAGVAYLYQWRKGSADISGATQATYVIASASPDDAGAYSVRVRNEAGESTASGNLSVRPAAAPVIIAQPRSDTLFVGQPASFYFAATGSFPRTYQWFRDGSAISGATSEMLEIASLTTAHAGAYSVRVTNSLGSATSTAALLSVNAATPVVLSPNSPADGTYVEGSAVVLQPLILSGASPHSYQWLKGGVPIEGATSSTLRFEAIGLNDAGAYSVRVGNVLGAVVSRTAVIAVEAAMPASISTQPQSVAVFEGESASFSVRASGTSIRYQ